MKKVLFTLAFSLVALVMMQACGEGSESYDVVESGSYMGTISEVEAEETEIYVDLDNGKKLELYFTDETQVTMNGNSAVFEDLQEGAKVEVTVEKKGQRMEPVTVKIMQ
ncbi:hypothetical protein AB9P05_22085 [Roseivirga sp. BDSF3-8]|uniref:hypothetical protein n=1 Tax=Roseivirga sp. BDSF3-8 TaxID=3241598 RepID=UPI003531D57E